MDFGVEVQQTVVVFWLGLLLAGFVMWLFLWAAAGGENETLAVAVGMTLMAAILALFVAGLVVTWKWFGSRKRHGGRPQ